MRFAHLGDCHLGSWRQPELQELNFLSFQQAIKTCLEEKVEFVLFAGDLFDSAYPPIEILKLAFAEFRRLKEAGIKCYIIAGSHDYSVSGKTFLDVLEKAGFCEMCKFHEDEENDKCVLHPIKHNGFEIYGYPGKKSGLEVADVKKLVVPDSSNFRILMLHTSLTEAVGDLPIESLDIAELPEAEYYALAHLHINFEKEKNGKPVIYSGAIFPNSFQELEDIGLGSFYIVDVTGLTEPSRREIKIKEVKVFKIELKNALQATAQIINEFDKHDLQDKIVLLRLSGILEQGTNADIDYQKIKEYLDEKKAYSFLKNTHKLSSAQEDLKSDITITATEMDKVEEALIKDYQENNPDKFNKYITQLIDSLNLEKQEDEKTAIYENRLFSELSKVLGVELG